MLFSNRRLERFVSANLETAYRVLTVRAQNLLLVVRIYQKFLECLVESVESSFRSDS